jgi:hypothetical protein
MLIAVNTATPVCAEINYERIEPTAKALARLQSLTPEAVAKGVVIDDDDLETRAELSTIDAYKDNGRFTDRVRSDNCVRAWIDKKTGAVEYQLYQTVNYNYEWRDFTFVNYASPAGPQTAKVDRIAHDVVSCYAGTCSYSETVGFMVDEDFLKTIASQYVPGNSPLWRFKFRATKGPDWEDSISPAEVAGLLLAVEQYRTAHALGDE